MKTELRCHYEKGQIVIFYSEFYGNFDMEEDAYCSDGFIYHFQDGYFTYKSEIADKKVIKKVYSELRKRLKC